MSKPFWNKITEKKKPGVLKVLKGDMDTLTRQEVKDPKLEVTVDDNSKRLKQIDRSKRLSQSRFELELTKKVGKLETRLLNMEKDGFKIPTFDDFMEYCYENRNREFCDYFARRLDKNPRRKPDNATITKVLDILRKMADQ